MSMFQAPVAPMARFIAITRPSHAAWNTGSFDSGSTLPNPSMPPMSCTPSIAATYRYLLPLALRSLRQPGADHRVAGDDLGKAVLAPAVRAGGPHRQHQEPRLGGRIPHPDLGLLRQRHAEIGEHAARILDGPRAIRRGLVPDRRQAEHF